MIRGILLIVVDCLRADHVSAYGYDRNTTPTIDALAQQGILWKNAYAASSWTKPSVASMLTGLYPTAHGAWEGIKRRAGLSATSGRLNTAPPTLPESLSKLGWRCAGFINNAQLAEFTGLNRGFCDYSPNMGKADRILASFGDWLRYPDNRPTFTYLHFLEAHWPYQPRRRHIAMFGGNRETNHYRDFSARDFAELRRRIARQETTLTEDLRTQMVQMYDGAVRRLDGKIKIALRMLKEAGRLDDTAIFITADHGEEFLEHGRIGHGHSLHEETTHVPLVGSIPSGPRGVRRDAPVSLTQLYPTILRLAGAPDPPSGIDLLDAREDHEPVYTELHTRHRYQQTIRHDHWKLHRRFRVPHPADPNCVTGCQNGDATTMEPVDDLLFDLRNDPTEQVDLIKKPEFRRVFRRLQSEIDHWWGILRDSAPATPSVVEIEPVLAERIRALGYLE